MNIVELFFLINLLKQFELWDILYFILNCMEDKLKECEFIFPAITLTTQDLYYDFFYSDSKRSRLGVQDPRIYLSLIKSEEDIKCRPLYPDGIYSHLCGKCKSIFQEWRETCICEDLDSPSIDDESCNNEQCSIKDQHIITIGVYKYKNRSGEIRYSMSIDLFKFLKHDCSKYGWRYIILRVFRIGRVLFDIKKEGKCGIYYSSSVKKKFLKQLSTK